jgi:hypothetical protein
MAFSKAPTQDTYSSERISLAREINTRPGVSVTKDEDYLNCYINPVRAKIIEDKRTFITSRSGTANYLTALGSSEVRGGYYWRDQGKLLYVTDDDIYIVSLETDSVTTLANQFSTTSGFVGCAEFLFDDNTIAICMTDGTTLLTVDASNTVTVCTSPDMPTSHLPYPIFLDGFLFLAKENTGDIYNSNLNDPLAWTAGDFISCEMEGDYVRRIAKLNNYLLAFGTNTIEYFWDAANDTGSPLQRNDTPVKINGYLGGFAQLGEKIFFVGNATQSSPDVFKLEGLKMEPVGSQAVVRYLSTTGITYGSMYGNIISTQGKDLYVLTAGTYTWVMDIEDKLWHRWSYKQQTSFPILFSANVKTTSGYKSIFSLVGSAQLGYFSELLTTDNGTAFTVKFVTEPADFGTMNRKTMSRCSIICDRTDNDASVLLQWSDDDYKTWNTGLSIELNQDLPSCYRLGSFRQRSFKLSYTGSERVRFQQFEVDINKGVH